MAFRKSNYNEWNHHLSWEKETITIDQGLLDSCHLHDLLPSPFYFINYWANYLPFKFIFYEIVLSTF